ncbi:MAG TPA: glycosyltransferase [Acidimicrobiia bacterium]
MRASQWLAARRGRVALLTLMAVGWTGVVLGAAAGQEFVVALGAGVVAVANLVIAKAVLETRSSVDTLNRTAARSERSVARLKAGVDRLRARTGSLETRVASMEPRINDLRAETPAIKDKITALGAESASLSGEIAEVRKEVANLETAHDVTRTGLVTTRALTDKLAKRNLAARTEEDRLRLAATPRVASPLLSIAIPSFNRPRALAELLTSIANEVAACPEGLVELCITDDASPDPETLEVALAFVEEHTFASLRIQPSNVGLERNVMAAAEPCRGEYLMVVGNDDLLERGALGTILDDINGTDAPVLLYGKRRINLDGSPRADVAGSIPIELAPGEAHLFPTLVEAAGEQGLLSTFGFAGPIVVKREPFIAVDPSPYLELTLYARACVLIEAFAGSQVFYRNTTTIVHRTQSPVEKHAESLGRMEEEFMSGGRTRLSRYFGTTLAAAMQRLIDRGVIDPHTIALMPERMMSNRLFVDWIANNRSMDPTFDETLSKQVVDDADRFFAALEADLAHEVR